MIGETLPQTRQHIVTPYDLCSKDTALLPNSALFLFVWDIIHVYALTTITFRCANYFCSILI